jgi:hypothetical protein
MGLARLWSRVGPPSVLLLAALLVTAASPPQFSAAFNAPARVDCVSLVPVAAAAAALSPTSAAPALTVRPLLGKRGELTGRALTAQAGTRAPVSLTLPTESFVGQPAGDLVVYTHYTAAGGSEVRALNTATGCDVRLAAPSGIVRSAVLDPDARAVFVHSVTQASRADAGVLRYDLASGSATQLVAPLSPSDDLGPIFGTDLRWSADGTALAVQSCGFSRCLTRVLDIATGGVAVFDRIGQGAFIALTAEHLVTYASCPGLPCAVHSTDLATGVVSVLAEEAFDVTAVRAEAGTAGVNIETAAGLVEVIQ